MRSDHDDDWDSIREKIIGLGEQSIRKSYYPQLQQRLSELERFRALLDETNDVIFLSEVPSCRFADFNNSACEQLGYSPQEMLKMSVEDFIAPDEIQKMKDLIGKLIEEKHLKNRKTIETVLLRQDNSLITVEINISWCISVMIFI
jgi:PAS domain S-box-containing protein